MPAIRKSSITCGKIRPAKAPGLKPKEAIGLLDMLAQAAASVEKTPDAAPAYPLTSRPNMLFTFALH
ncbi:hypothetical protein FBU31_004306, partial [Coemansia sp. 'formosensis']